MLEFRDKGSSRTQFAAMSGEVVVASISKALGTTYWRWTFYMTAAGPRGFQQHGTAPSFDEAKAAVEQRWTHWLAAAGLRSV
jgi:hypothetical protein